jgi:hypothetical protein
MGFAWVLTDAQEAALFDPPVCEIYLPRHRKPARPVRAWHAAAAMGEAVLEWLTGTGPTRLPRLVRRTGYVAARRRAPRHRPGAAMRAHA